MDASSIAIMGAGGHAVSVADAVVSSGWDLVCFIDPEFTEPSLLGFPVLASLPDGDLSIVVALGDNTARERVAQAMRHQRPRAQFPTVIHPSASVSRFAQICQGTVILQNAIVGSAARVGEFCIVNSGASVDHECAMGDFSSVAPHATLGGRARLGRGSFVGMSGVVKQGIAVGAGTVVGACSFVDRDLPDLVVAYGIPARVVRARDSNDSYLR